MTLRTLFCLLCWLPLSNAQSIPQVDRQLIDKMFADFSGARPGASVMIAKGDELLFCKSYGLANLELESPATCDTHYRVGSVSKQFTAMAILRLIDAGKLTFETTLGKVFPEFPSYGRKVTVLHCMTHQSGLPSYGPLAAKVTDGEQLSDRDVLEYLMTLEAGDFEPGTNFQYSNSAFAVLAEVIAKTSGVPFFDFMRHEVLFRAGMKTTQLYSADREIPQRGMGYQITGDSIELKDQSATSAIAGDGSIYTSANEYFRWHQALCHEQIVSPELHRAVYEAQPGTGGRYGLGWFVSKNDGLPFVEHGGSTAGFVSYVARIPQEKITVAIFTNRNMSRLDPASSALAPRAHALLSIATQRRYSMPSETVLSVIPQ